MSAVGRVAVMSGLGESPGEVGNVGKDVGLQHRRVLPWFTIDEWRLPPNKPLQSNKGKLTCPLLAQGSRQLTFAAERRC